MVRFDHGDHAGLERMPWDEGCGTMKSSLAVVLSLFLLWPVLAEADSTPSHSASDVLPGTFAVPGLLDSLSVPEATLGEQDSAFDAKLLQFERAPEFHTLVNPWDNSDGFGAEAWLRGGPAKLAIVPEPSTITILGMGLAGIFTARRLARRKEKNK